MGIAAVMCVKALYWTAVIMGYCTTLMMLIMAHPQGNGKFSIKGLGWASTLKVADHQGQTDFAHDLDALT